MSKRPLKPLSLGRGANKLPKLEVTISEHNFPLSQNQQQRSSHHDAIPADEWGDVDDDLLLQASQACEQVEQHNESALPEYSAWIQAPSTSTQLQTQLNSSLNPFSYGQSVPTTSKAANVQSYQASFRENKKEAPSLPNAPNGAMDFNKDVFQFKRPMSGVSGVMKDRSTTPLAGSRRENVTDDLLILDNLKEDSEHLYRKLVQMQEENERLKSDNGKLLEQALSKDGEVTILRGRLRGAAAAADAARLERLRADEQLRAEWAERLGAATKQLGSLRTQLDCKELEVVRVKERYRMLESNKVRLSQTMPPPAQNHRVQHSQRHNHCSFSIEREMSGARVTERISVHAQTRHAAFLRLHSRLQTTDGELAETLLRLLEPQAAEPSAEPGEEATERAPAAPRGLAALRTYLASLTAVDDWSCLTEEHLQICFDVVREVEALLAEALAGLRRAARRPSGAARRDLDGRYVRELARCAPVAVHLLAAGGAMFSDERALTARRGAAALARLCSLCAPARRRAATAGDLVGLMTNIAERVGSASCGVQYSGLLLSFVHLAASLLEPASPDDTHSRLGAFVRAVTLARPCPAVLCAALPALRLLATRKAGLAGCCTESAAGNLKFDYAQGWVLFKDDSCFLQVYLHQLETCLKCMERERRVSDVVSLAQGLLSVYRNADSLDAPWCQFNVESSCKCARRLARVLVYTLHVCARMLKDGVVDETKSECPRGELAAACRCGVAALHLWALRDAELRPLLAHYEGHHRAFLDLCGEMRAHVAADEIQGDVLTELTASLQPSAEEVAEPLRDVWTDSFSRFQLTD